VKYNLQTIDTLFKKDDSEFKDLNTEFLNLFKFTFVKALNKTIKEVWKLQLFMKSNYFTILVMK